MGHYIKTISHYLFAVIIGCIFSISSQAQIVSSFETPVPIAYLLDYRTGVSLYQKNADRPQQPANLTKIATALMAFDALKNGDLLYTDEIFISVDSWRRGGAPARGTTMYAEVNSNVPVPDLLRGLIIQSGNDAALALAAHLYENEVDFAKAMNDYIHALGYKTLNFVNATGYEAEGQQITAREMAHLSRYLIQTHQEHYKMFGERDFIWNGIFQRNRNPLLAAGIGVDGFNTGSIGNNNYHIVASAEQNGRRLIAVILGAESARVREVEAQRLLEWGFANFQPKLIFEAGESLGYAKIFGGVENNVELYTKTPVAVPLAANADDDVRAHIVYQGPLLAPFHSDLEVGHVQVSINNEIAVEVPVYTRHGVQEAGLSKKAWDGVVDGLIVSVRRTLGLM